jgi:DNA-binding winged helix-turn-helix (wHTH) protein/tetratricopeptide (TPR) repeat protein
VVDVGATQKLLRFGVFELNLDVEELRKDGILIKLPPQPVKVLALLASRAGQMVTRDEIQKEIWGEETYVDFEHGLNQCIKQIRTALNDNADKPLYVETIPRRGYRFLAPVVSKTVAAPAPRVTESSSGVQSRISLPTAVIHSSDAVVEAPINPQTKTGIITTGTTAAVASEADVSSVHKALRRKPQWLFAWVAAGLVAVAAIAYYWQIRRASPLTEKDTIVLADFDNSTGTPVFDVALKQALTADLEQSPFLNVLPAGRVRQQLRFMGQAPDTPLKEDVARQVCQRTGSTAMLMGSISSLGSHYPMALRAENCDTGDLLAIVQGEAENREQVVRVLNKMASSMRGKLGESLASIQKYDAPISQVSTPSLEALQAYSLGISTQQSQGEEAAIPLYRRAVELDTNFAMAYSRLGVAYLDLYQPTLAAEYFEKAFQLRDHTTEKEKLTIEGIYYMEYVGDLQKATETYTVYSQIYPREGKAHSNLSVIDSFVGNYEKAVAEANLALQLDPNNANYYGNCAALYLYIGKFDKARTILEQAKERKLENEYIAQNRYLLAFLTGNNTQMDQQVAAATGKPGWEDPLIAMQSGTEAYFGRLAKAAEDSSHASESAIKADSKETAATWRLYGALQHAEAGMLEPALREATAALAISPGKNTQILGPLALARSGDWRRAQTLSDELAKQHPFDTMVQYYWLPAIRAAIDLNNRAPAKAIEDLQPALPYELGSPNPGIGLMYPAYLRGIAYLQAGQPERAAAEFQKVLANRGIVQNYITGALAQLQLGRAQAKTGNESGLKSYESFFALWKDADPSVPILIEAKTEYAKLK